MKNVFAVAFFVNRKKSSANKIPNNIPAINPKKAPREMCINGKRYIQYKNVSN